MKTYSKPSDTPNKCLKQILQWIEVVPDLKYLEIERGIVGRNLYRIRTKYTDVAISEFMHPERLLIWFEAYIAGTKNEIHFKANQEYEQKLINKEKVGKVTITWETANCADDENGGYLEWIPQSQEYNVTEAESIAELLRFEGCNRNVKVKY